MQETVLKALLKAIKYSSMQISEIVFLISEYKIASGGHELFDQFVALKRAVCDAPYSVEP